MIIRCNNIFLVKHIGKYLSQVKDSRRDMLVRVAVAVVVVVTAAAGNKDWPG
jgi:hypothetical protein